MQKILFLGDCHGDFSHLRKIGRNAEAIVLLGDQEPSTSLHLELDNLPETWWILGNHDSDDPAYLERHTPMASQNLHCRLVDICGLRIAGLGGVFRSNYFPVDQTTRLSDIDLYCQYDSRAFKKQELGPGSHLELQTTIFPEDLAAILEFSGQIDVLVAHEAPESHPMGFPLIGDLARAVGARLLVHGHHHERYHGKISGKIRVEGVAADGFIYSHRGPSFGMSKRL